MRIRPRLALTAAAISAMLLASSCGSAIPQQSSSATSTPILTGDGIVVIARGDSGRQIARKLQEAGVTRADHFAFLAQRDPEAVLIQPGTYRLDTGLEPQQALEQLLDPARKESGLVVVEGARLSRIVDDLAARLDIPAARVEKAAEQLAAERGPLEGYLYPATYDVDGLTPLQALSTMRDRFDEQDIKAVQRKARKQGITLQQAVVIASLLQAEVRPGDFRKAARAIYNRLEAGMPLQIDSTVNYAAGSSTLELSSDDLALDSPYNTYRVKGLPPGPIGSPGEQALQAAVDPADGDWLYWVSVNPEKGITRFAVTYDEFLSLKQQYRDWLASR